MNARKVLNCVLILVMVLVAMLLLNGGAAVPAQAQGTTIFVNDDATGGNNGASWANAFTSLQTALTTAQSGDEIWVASGIYTPGLTVSSTFELKSGVALYGGFVTTETLRDQRNWTLHKSILSGDIDRNDRTVGGVVTDTSGITGTNTYHVVMGSGVDGTAVLDGFTITAGMATGNGGGMYNDNGSPTLTNVIFSGNQGGGMYNDSSSPSLTNVTFSGNTATSGGGMYNSASNPTLTNVVFSGNQGSGMYNAYSSPILTNVTFNGNQGGGMYNQNSSPTLTDVTFGSNSAYYGGGMYNGSSNPTLMNVIFTGNQATTYGGGMENDSSSPTLINVVFSGNQADSGGGMYNGSSNPTLINVTFSGNQARSGSVYNRGGGMCNYDSSPRLVNSILWGDSAVSGGNEIYNSGSSNPIVTYSDVRDGYAGTGNINVDPQFVAPIAASAAPTTTGNYRLRANSPAIDKGNTTRVIASADLDGSSRISGAAVDMGAYEYRFGSWLFKSADPSVRVSRHGLITYTLVLSNAQSTTDTHVLITDTLPSQVEFAQWVISPSGTLCNGNAITWTGSLPVGQIITFTFQVTHTGGYGEVVMNTAHFSGTQQQESTSAAFIVERPIYVDKDAPGPARDGVSWTTAYTDVQTALAAAVSGDEIWVAEGVYYPSATSQYVSPTFQLKNGVALYGGFGGYGISETQRTQRDWTAHVAVLSGDIDRNDITDTKGVVTTTTNIRGSNTYHVVENSSGVIGTAVLDGFTITAGNATYSSSNCSDCGGGMFNWPGNSPALMNVTFRGNSARMYGGGMWNWWGSNPILTNVTFSGNSAPHGSGMSNQDNRPTLMNVTFSGNSGVGMYNNGGSKPTLTNVTFNGNQGGGMGNQKSSPTLTNVVFSSNQGSGMSNSDNSNPTLTNVTFVSNQGSVGGGMSNSHSSPMLTNVTFVGNQATTGGGGGMMNSEKDSSPTLVNVVFIGNQANFGGGMYNYWSGNLTLINVTFSGNKATNYYGGGIFNDGSSSLTLYNCILWGDSASSGGNEIYGGNLTVTYSDVQGGYSGAGNINSDPQFVAPVAASAAPTTTGNYRLQLTSPAIDAGNSFSVTASTDLDGNPRIQGNAVDMGAYETAFGLTGVTINGPATGTVNTAYTFTATVSPIMATTPITYFWQATGQTPITHTGSLIYSDTANFTWSVGGAKTITVTASNAAGVVTATHTITQTPSNAVILTISDGSGRPGSTGNLVTISADNQTAITTPIASAQFVVIYNSTIGISLTNVSPTSRASSFNASLSQDFANPAAVKATILFYNLSGQTIASGTGPILDLRFDVSSSATPGVTATLVLSPALLSDAASNLIPADYRDTGQFTILSPCACGDVNCDGVVNVFDLQRSINMILRTLQPDPTLYPLDQWTRADMTGDGQWNVFDLQRLINCIMDRGCVCAAPSVLARSAINLRRPASTNVISLPDITARPGASGSFDIGLNNQDIAAASEIHFIYSSTLGLNVTGVRVTPRTTGFSASFSLDTSNPAQTKAKVLLYNMSNLTIAPGSGPIVTIDYTLAPTATGSTPLSLTLALLSDSSASPLPVTPVNGSFTAQQMALTVSKTGAGSGTVSLNPDQADYPFGTVVTLTAVPSNTSVFAGWSGSVVTTTNPVTVTMDADKVVTATFNLYYRLLLPIVFKN